MRPGIITSPDQVPRGDGYGNPGPDAGWAYRIIDVADVPDLSSSLRNVLGTLMGARAAFFGRAPTKEDLDVALLLCGIGDALPPGLADRRMRWTDAAAHDKPPGRTALAEVGMDLLRHKPAEVRLRVSRSE